MPRVSFTTSQLSAILDALEQEMPGEMPNAIMDILTRRLIVNGNVSKSVDVNPETSEFVHSYTSDESDSDYDSSDSSDYSSSDYSSSEYSGESSTYYSSSSYSESSDSTIDQKPKKMKNKKYKKK